MGGWDGSPKYIHSCLPLCEFLHWSPLLLVKRLFPWDSPSRLQGLVLPLDPERWRHLTGVPSFVLLYYPCDHPKSHHSFANSLFVNSVQFSSVAQSCLTLCNPMNRSTPGLPVHHQLLEFIQTHVHRVGDAIQPSHPLLSPFPPAPNPSQHQGLFQWVNSSHEVAKVLEFQLQHQSFQWTARTDLL